MAKILITKSGCYAVKDGQTVSLKCDVECEVEDRQAEIFVKSGKAKLITNIADDEPLDDVSKTLKKSK